MSERLVPVSWDDLARKLNSLGFTGPYRTGKHNFMVKEELRLTIPNPHKTDVSVGLLKQILNRGGVSRQEWTKADKRK